MPITGAIAVAKTAVTAKAAVVATKAAVVAVTAGGHLMPAPVGHPMAVLASASPPVVTLTPTMSGLPGGTALQGLVNGLGAWALVFSLVALVVGAAVWALGAHSRNYHQSFVGRRAVLVSAIAALLVGAAPALINFFYAAGTHVHR